MGEPRTILILGAGVMQLPAIRAAHRLGLRVVAADANPNAPGVSEADIFEHVDLGDRPGMIAAARRYHEKGQLHAVFTAGTDFSRTVAAVADALGLPGTSLDSAENATDKFRMRQVLADAGVPVPKFSVLEKDELSEQTVSREIATIGLPVVVKPADSMGARGVVRADSVADALREARISVAHSRSGRVVIEGYIDGPEFSLDAIVYRGAVQITGFADRHIRFPPHFIEVGHTMPTAIPADDQARVSEVFRRGVAALGISDGAAKGDMKLSPDGPVVGEIAARLSGGFMSGWTYPFSSGVELTAEAIRIALGEAPGSLAQRWHRTSAERAVISIPGVVSAVRGADLVGDRPEIGALFVSASPGDLVNFPRNNVEKCGNIISVAEDREGAISAAERGVADIEVVLKRNEARTLEFLFTPAPTHWAYNPDDLPADWLSRVLPQGALSAGGNPAVLAEIAGRARRVGRDRKPVGLGQLPATADLCDWSWRSLASTVRMLERSGAVRTDEFDPDAAAPVWLAILRGGLQGGRYVLGDAP